MNSGFAAQNASPSAPPVRLLPADRLVGALSSLERELFLPPPVMAPALPAATTVRWLEDSGRGMTPERWMKLNPEIVLTGWSSAALPAEWIEAPTCALRYVCHLTGSVRRLVPRRFFERGGLVTNWGNIPSVTVAEHALLLALAALRNLGAWSRDASPPADTAQRVQKLNTRSLHRQRVGLHGFGRIARALVTLLRPFGVELHAFSSGVPAAVLHEAGVTPCESLPALFARSDVLFECEALTPATAGSVTAEVLARLPAGAVFVNIGRGGLVDEPALLAAARAGRLRVALDVVASGPFAPAGPFATVPGAVLSPHIGGPTFDQYAECGELAWRNLGRYLRGEAVEAVVTLADYDRAT